MANGDQQQQQAPDSGGGFGQGLGTLLQYAIPTALGAAAFGGKGALAGFMEGSGTQEDRIRQQEVQTRQLEQHAVQQLFTDPDFAEHLGIAPAALKKMGNLPPAIIGELMRSAHERQGIKEIKLVDQADGSQKAFAVHGDGTIHEVPQMSGVKKKGERLAYDVNDPTKSKVVSPSASGEAPTGMSFTKPAATAKPPSVTQLQGMAKESFAEVIGTTGKVSEWLDPTTKKSDKEALRTNYIGKLTARGYDEDDATKWADAYVDPLFDSPSAKLKAKKSAPAPAASPTPRAAAPTTTDLPPAPAALRGKTVELNGKRYKIDAEGHPTPIG